MPVISAVRGMSAGQDGRIPTMPVTSRRVVVLRGHSVNPWELRSWERLGPGYDVAVLVSEGNLYDADVALERVAITTVSDRFSRLPGPLDTLATRAVGERYLRLEERLRGADIVHAAELGFWFSWQAARLKSQLGYRLVLTCWETIPFADAYRNVRTRRYRRDVLAATDLFLAATERARDALLVEGADPARIAVAPPGIDVERFAAGRDPAPQEGRLVLSVGRLVWEKGHQDVLRALALLRERGEGADLRVLIVGTGGEGRRLRGVIADLGLEDRVELRGSVPYDELPGVYARASCLVLASLPTPYWEEQFGMVLAEAMAAHLPLVVSTSGAIPEVAGPDASYFAPGDWVGLAGVLARVEAGARRAPQPERLQAFSSDAAAERLRAAYDGLFAN
jgi:glycosyltransferase involved in cell wall biosynthesis